MSRTSDLLEKKKRERENEDDASSKTAIERLKNAMEAEEPPKQNTMNSGERSGLERLKNAMTEDQMAYQSNFFKNQKSSGSSTPAASSASGYKSKFFQSGANKTADDNNEQKKLKTVTPVQTSTSGEAWTRATESQTKVPERVQREELRTTGTPNYAGKTSAVNVREQERSEDEPSVFERALNVLTGAIKGSTSDYIGAAATGLEGIKQYDMAGSSERRKAAQEQENAAHYREMLARGTMDDGTVIDPQMRTWLENLAARAEQRSGVYAQGNETIHAPLSDLTDRTYNAADVFAAGSSEDIERAKESAGAVGQFLVDAGVAGAQMAGDIAMGVVTGGGAMPFMAARSFGGGSREARQNGATFGQQVVYGAGSAALSAATEKISNVAEPFKAAFGTGVLDDVIGKVMARLGNNAVGKIALSAISEGGEEFVEAVFQPILQRATFDKNASFDLEDALYSAAIGGVLGGLGGGVDAVMNRDQQNNAKNTPVSASSEPVTAEYSENKPEISNTTLRRAAEQMEQEGRVSGKSADRILEDPEAIDALTKATGMSLEPSVTNSQRRAAVKSAAETLASRRNESSGEAARVAPTTSRQATAAVNTRTDNASVFGENGQKAYRLVLERGDLAEEVYYSEFAQAYNAGLNGNKLGTARIQNLTAEQARTAYVAGKSDAAITLAKEKAAAPYAKVYGNDAGLVYDDYVEANLDNQTFKTLNTVAKMLGTRVRFVARNSIAGGQANASIRNGEVLIERDNPNPVRALLGHEWTHRLQELAPAEYNRFRSVVAQDQSITYKIDGVIAAYKRNGLDISYEEALDEAVANYAGRMVEDTDFLENFVRKHSKDRTLLEKVRDAIRELVGKLTGEYRRKAESAEGRLTAALVAAASQVEENRTNNKNTVREDTKFSLKGTEQLIEKIDRIVKEGNAVGRSDADMKADIRAAVEEVYRGMISEYGAFAPGENPAREVKVPKRTAKDKKVSQTVRTILEAKKTPDEIIPAIEELVARGEFSYDTYTDEQAIKDAGVEIEHLGVAQAFSEWTDSVRDGEVSKKNTAMGWALYNNAANNGDSKTALSILENMVEHQRSAAQALQATRILKKLSPETQLYQVQRSVDNLQKELNARYRKKGWPTLKVNQELAEQFIQARDQEKRDAILRDIYRDVGRQMPSRFRDKWNAWRYLAMLGNPRTHVRNIVGNAGFAPVVAVKNLTATAIESAVNRVSGGNLERTKGAVGLGKKDRALLSAAWNDYAKVQETVLGGGKYSDFANANKYIEEGRAVFKNNGVWGTTAQSSPAAKLARKTTDAAWKPLEQARKANSVALDTEDVWFSKPHYAAAMAQYCKARGITAEQIAAGKNIKQARAYAIAEARKATYLDTNALSHFFSKRFSERGEYAIAGKVGNIFLEGIIPFRKTPANILARGIEYSPLGLLKGLSWDLWQVRHGQKTGAEAIDNISAGLTGTGLLAMGVYLAAQGLVRGHGGEDEEENKFEELMGHQAYSLELPDGTSVTLDWLSPECLPFFVGVNLWEQTGGEKEELTLSTVLSSVATVSEPLLEMSCLQSLNDVFDSVGYAASDGLEGLPAALSSAATSYLTQCLPTLLGQAERTSENMRMATYTEKDAFLTSDMQYALGRSSARIPGLDYQQIPYIDAWGRTEQTGTAAERAFNNFLNPAYTSDIETSKMEEELLRLYRTTGESGVLPSRAEKDFTVDGEKKKLTAEEYIAYATQRGQIAYNLIVDLTASKQYQRLNNSEKANAVKEAYDLANQTAKAAISSYEPESWIKKSIEAEKKYGISRETYITLKTQTADIQSLKDANGETIANSKGLLIMQEVYNTPGLTDQQRKAMFEYLGVGKTILHWSKALVNEKLCEMKKMGQ